MSYVSSTITMAKAFNGAFEESDHRKAAACAERSCHVLSLHGKNKGHPHIGSFSSYNMLLQDGARRKQGISEARLPLKSPADTVGEY